MKKAFICILSLLILSANINVFADNVTISLVCNETVDSEDAFDVYVTITENSNIGGGSLNIIYDCNVLTLLSVTKDDLLENAVLQSNIASAKVSWASTNNVTSAGNLIKLSFKAKPTYEDIDTVISLENVKLTDSDLNPVSSIAIDGALLVKAKKPPAFSVETNDMVLPETTFDVRINISENTKACGGRFDLIFDSSKLEIVSTEVGNILSDSTAYINERYLENAIRMNFVSIEPLTKSGCLLTVKFKASNNASGLALFDLQNCKITDNNDISIQSELLDMKNAASIRFLSEAPTNPTIFVSNVAKSDKVTCDVRLVSPNALSGVVLVGLYGDDKLLDFKIYDAQQDIPVTINTTAGSMLKVMWWDGFGNMRPLAEAVEKNLD